MSKVPTNVEQRKLTPIGRWLKEANKELDFVPSKAMERAKARLWDTINSNPYLTTALEDLTLQAIVEMSGQPKILDWMDTNPSFLSWFCDQKFEKYDMEAMAQVARRVIEEILTAPLEEKLLTAKDKLNAANMLLQLADKFPNKRREFVYVDKELGRMGLDEVDRETKRLDKLLTNGIDNEGK